MRKKKERISIIQDTNSKDQNNYEEVGVGQKQISWQEDFLAPRLNRLENVFFAI